MPKNVKEQSVDDIKWIESATTGFGFEENDRLKQVVDQLKEESKALFSGTEALDDVKCKEEVLELFEELTELVELSAQNCMNLCRMGGL